MKEADGGIFEVEAAGPEALDLIDGNGLQPLAGDQGQIKAMLRGEIPIPLRHSSTMIIY